MWKMWIKPQSGFEWHFTCVKSRFLASMRVKIILGPKRVRSIFWHELLNLPVSSLAGIHATKIKLNIYFLCTAFRIDARHDCVSPVTLQHSTSYSSVDTQTSFQSAERGGKKKELIHLSEKRQRFSWGFIAENELLKLKGVSGAISLNHSGGR